MSKLVTTPSDPQWIIDLNWLKTNRRSFTILTRGALCPKCRKKLKADTQDVNAAELLKTIQSCCSKADDFITPRLPFQEAIFRVFLTTGNKPMTLIELGDEMRRRRGPDGAKNSPEFLARVLRNDTYYGVRPK
jgi:hypothetical protein